MYLLFSSNNNLLRVLEELARRTFPHSSEQSTRRQAAGNTGNTGQARHRGGPPGRGQAGNNRPATAPGSNRPPPAPRHNVRPLG